MIRKWIAALLCLGLLTGCAVTNEEEPEDITEEVTSRDANEARAERRLERMELREQIEQLLVLEIDTWNGAAFLNMDEELTDYFSAHSFGGLVLTSANCTDIAQVVQLNHDLQSAACAGNGIPMFLMTEQEGGVVTSIPFGTATPGNMALGAAGQPSLTRASAGIIGRELSALGFNVNLAPCVDITDTPSDSLTGLRSFSDDPLQVSRLARAYVQGLAENNVIGALNAFPGLGNAELDPGTGIPCLHRTRQELEQMEFLPYHELGSDNAEMIMAGHIAVPLVEEETYTSKLDGSELPLPASMSRVLLQEILREELGFNGIVMTESMQDEVIRTHFDPVDAAVLALNAGADLIHSPVLIENSESFAKLDAYVDALMEKIPEEISEERVAEAVKRVLTGKARNGVLDYYRSETVDSKSETARTLVGTYENHVSERAIADQTVTVLRNEQNVLPLHGGGTILFAGAAEEQMNALRFGYERLMSEINLAYFARYVNVQYGKNLNGVLRGLKDCDGVVITSDLENLRQLDPKESSMISSVQQVIAACQNAGIPCIVISAGLPYDLSCYDSADALLAVYNPSGANYDANDVIAPGYAPNISASLDIIFGYARPSGMIPLNIPKVNGTVLSDEIAYPGGSGLIW